MSRVSKLQKRNYAQRHGPHSRHVRRILNHNRSRKLRAAQKQRPHRCTCGHYDHGEYGCLQGCAWGLCNPVIDWRPFFLPDIHHPSLDIDALTEMLKAVRLPKDVVVIQGGDMISGDLSSARIHRLLDIRDQPVVK
jgi:hypothetical protein